MKLQHFTHPHPLSLSSWCNERAFCYGCGQRVSGPAYTCGECDVYLHQSCSKLASEINHPLHPQHPLTLSYDPQWEYRNLKSKSREELDKSIAETMNKGRFCEVCDSRLHFIYTCSECHFSLDVMCSLLNPSKDEPDYEPIQHLLPWETTQYHRHPLVPCDPIPNFGRNCFRCGLPFENDSIWVCLECHWLQHKSCAQLENGFNHPFHPEHHLSPSGLWSMCRACGYGPERSSRYGCYGCDFYLHDTCAFFLRPNDQPHDYPIQHLGQTDHTLFTCRMTKNFEISCSACRLPFDASMTAIYTCPQCRVLLHQSCLEWPLQIKHPFHPQHPLRLAPKSLADASRRHEKNEYGCSACGDSMYGCNY